MVVGGEHAQAAACAPYGCRAQSPQHGPHAKAEEVDAVDATADSRLAGMQAQLEPAQKVVDMDAHALQVLPSPAKRAVLGLFLGLMLSQEPPRNERTYPHMPRRRHPSTRFLMFAPGVESPSSSAAAQPAFQGRAEIELQRAPTSPQSGTEEKRTYWHIYVVLNEANETPR